MWKMALHPDLKDSKYGEYQEAWHLLRGESPCVIVSIQAGVEEYIAESAK